ANTAKAACSRCFCPSGHRCLPVRRWRRAAQADPRPDNLLTGRTEDGRHISRARPCLALVRDLRLTRMPNVLSRSSGRARRGVPTLAILLAALAVVSALVFQAFRAEQDQRATASR